MISDVSLTFSDTSALAGENVPRWVTELKSGRIPLIDCRPLTADQRKQLLESVRKAYRETYGERLASDEFSHRWEKGLQIATTSQLPVRVLIRKTVDLLDSERYWG